MFHRHCFTTTINRLRVWYVPFLCLASWHRGGSELCNFGLWCMKMPASWQVEGHWGCGELHSSAEGEQQTIGVFFCFFDSNKLGALWIVTGHLHAGPMVRSGFSMTDNCGHASPAHVADFNQRLLQLKDASSWCNIESFYTSVFSWLFPQIIDDSSLQYLYIIVYLHRSTQHQTREHGKGHVQQVPPLSLNMSKV